MPEKLPERRRVASAWVLSLLGHLALLMVGGALVARSLSSRDAVSVARTARTFTAARDDTVDIDLPKVSDGSVVPAPVPAQPLLSPPRGGGDTRPRPDSGRRGRGGADTSAQPALNLADRDDGIFLSPDVQSRLDRNQIPRVRSGQERTTREDWRASREPMEVTFLANGDVGKRSERRVSAERDPSAGARMAGGGAPSRRGGVVGSAQPPPGVGESPLSAGVPIEGGLRDAMGTGVRDGAPGMDHRPSAKVPRARPQVNEGTPSDPGDRQGRPSDTLDSEQEADAKRMQSILHAGTAGGAAGAGSGGEAGAGATGSGGIAGAGSVSRALGTGGGGEADVDPRDRMRTEYKRQARAKIGQLWAPTPAMLEGLQGLAIVTFTVRSDGSVTEPMITRTSGFAEYDEICRRAVRQAAPFGPLPAELGTSLPWSMPFEARNPAVRPREARADAQ